MVKKNTNTNMVSKPNTTPSPSKKLLGVGGGGWKNKQSEVFTNFYLTWNIFLQLKLLELFLGSSSFGYFQDIESDSFAERTTLSNGDNIPNLNIPVW